MSRTNFGKADSPKDLESSSGELQNYHGDDAEARA